MSYNKACGLAPLPNIIIAIMKMFIVYVCTTMRPFPLKRKEKSQKLASLLKLHEVRRHEYSYSRTYIYTDMNAYLSICLIGVHYSICLPGRYACLHWQICISFFVYTRLYNEHSLARTSHNFNKPTVILNETKLQMTFRELV